MLLEEIANTWSPPIYSLLHLTNFNFFLPKLQHEGTGKHNRDSEIYATLLLFSIWIILYLCYKTLLNSILRRMQFPFIKRNRIIDGLWYCGFSVCSMIFLTYFVPELPHQSCPWCKTSNFQLGFLIHKTFYLHRAMLEAFVHQHWLKGWTMHIFASDICTSLQYKWPSALSVLLFYEASDVGLLNSCKILLTLSRSKFVKRVAKFLFLLHFANWMYKCILLVPGSLISLYLDANHNWKIQTYLWMWLVCEFMNAVRNKEFGCMYSKQTLETSLFPPPSREAVEFVNIIKKHRNSINNNKVADGSSAQKQKTELWQTLFCAMTIKKKLKKRAQAKQATGEESTDLN